MLKKNSDKVLEAYRESIMKKTENLLMIIRRNDAVQSATLSSRGEIHIEFVEPVDIDGQNVLNVFIRGGAIKKSESKDNIEEQYFEIPAIGEF